MKGLAFYHEIRWSLGTQAVKNIAEPVRVYRVRLESGAAVPAVSEQEERVGGEAGRPLPPQGSAARRVLAWSWRQGALALVGLLLLLGGGVAVWQHALRPLAPAGVVPSKQALALPSQPSIAVLPFVNLSGDPEQEYFSDGMTEDLTTSLARLSSFFVIARNSAFTYKGKAVKIDQVQRELGVQYVLEGSVRKAENQVRITAQLVDATTGNHLWAERYDRPLQAIFALQDEITQQIVTMLKEEVMMAEFARVRRTPLQNLTAYDAFIRGEDYVRRATKEANAQGRQMFEKAIDVDPNYARAYAALGATYWQEWVLQWTQDPRSLERALELAQKAVLLDDSTPSAHRLLARLHLWKSRQHELAIAEVERAIALNPNDADSYVLLGNILTFAGRPEESIGFAEKAMRLHPTIRPTTCLNWATPITG
jgi:adenylate cyclase